MNRNKEKKGAFYFFHFNSSNNSFLLPSYHANLLPLASYWSMANLTYPGRKSTMYGSVEATNKYARRSTLRPCTNNGFVMYLWITFDMEVRTVIKSFVLAVSSFDSSITNTVLSDGYHFCLGIWSDPKPRLSPYTRL